MLNYTDITQNTNVQSWTVKEIMAREKCGFLQVQALYLSADNLIHVRLWVWSHIKAVQLMLRLYQNGGQLCHVTAGQSFVMYIAWNPKGNYDMSACVFVVEFNSFMSLTSLMLGTDINITETTYSCQF